jgi:uncharacterized protein YbjT (DUF2867 family)
MARIVEFGPVPAEARTAEFERVAAERGHAYYRRAAGEAAPTDATALILGPPDTIDHRTLRRLRTRRPGLHIVLVSHLLAGRAASYRDKPAVRSLRALETHLREGPNPWTILRPARLSIRYDRAHRTWLSQDAHADGLVSIRSLADAVITAIEHPGAAAGRTAAVLDVNYPGTRPIDLVGQFRGLELDLEATTPWLEMFA